MRRKDFKYYLKTIKLKWKSFILKNFQGSSDYVFTVQEIQQQYIDKWKQFSFNYQAFNPYFTSYFYFNSTSIFNKNYSFEEGVPVAFGNPENINPLLPFYYALVSINQGDKTGIESAVAFAQKNENKENGQLLFKYNFDYPLFGLEKPWVSGITQALAVSVFCRQYYESKDKKYLDSAVSAFAPLLTSVENGGLLRATKAGLEWVEEYPSNPASYVLNGHMFAIIAAIELFQLTGNPLYKINADQWLYALIFHLPEYQYETYLLHNKLQSKLSNIEYQGLYVGLFKHLYKLTNHPLLQELELFYNKAIDWNDFKRFYGMD